MFDAMTIKEQMSVTGLRPKMLAQGMMMKLA
jgi:hypothetical protein